MIEIFTAIGSFAAVGALVVSIVSLAKSSKVEKLQKEVSELDSRLKQYELENVEKNREACVEARLVKDGKGHYLKVFNKGEGVALNVNYLVDSTCEYATCFRKDKTPFPRLEQHGSYEEHVMVFMGFPSMVEVTTTWKDENGNDHSKVNYVTY